MANDNKPNPNKIKVNPWFVYGAIFLILMLISVFSGGSNFQEALPTNSSKFNTLLEKGDVEKVIVYNKDEAEVFLTAAALKDSANKAVAKDLLNRPNKGPHYVFNIGNDEIFQNQLVKAEAEGKLKSHEFKARSNWSDLLISLLPIIIIVGIWIFIMRRMSGGAGCCGRHTSNTGI